MTLKFLAWFLNWVIFQIVDRTQASRSSFDSAAPVQPIRRVTLRQWAEASTRRRERKIDAADADRWRGGKSQEVEGNGVRVARIHEEGRRRWTGKGRKIILIFKSGPISIIYELGRWWNWQAHNVFIPLTLWSLSPVTSVILSLICFFWNELC